MQTTHKPNIKSAIYTFTNGKIYSSHHETGYPQREVIKHSCFSFGLMIKVSLIPAADRFHQNLGTKPSAKFNSSCHAGHRANTIVISKIT